MPTLNQFLHDDIVAPPTDQSIVVAAFYCFIPIDEPAELRAELLSQCESLQLRGSILLAHEGINATICGSALSIQQMMVFLATTVEEGLPDQMSVKISYAAEPVFRRMKVRIRPEIVTLGKENIDPRQQAGQYVEPSDWNALIAQPDVLLIDARNDFEVQLGTFEGAVNPHTASFSQLPVYIDQHFDPNAQRRVAMFCTGGIRCEKATSYLLEQGFEQVFHLRGGILDYLEQIPEAETRWHGECFVFDERISLTHGLDVGTAAICEQCHTPVPADRPCDCIGRDEAARRAVARADTSAM